MTTLGRPDATEYAPYYGRYISLVPDGDVVTILEQQQRSTAALLAALSEAEGDHRYAPEKWSIKEVVCHVADAERVFAYRALRFSRGDQAPLAGFDEKPWVPESGAAVRTLKSVASELSAVRGATLALIGSLTQAQAMRHGVASNVEVSVRALAFLIAGHEAHHVRILKERYLGH